MVDNNLETGDKKIQSTLKFNESFSDRITFKIIKTFGNLFFLLICIALFIFWILWNSGVLGYHIFDPYPFSMLTLVVSLFAIVLSLSVLITQNRESKMASIRQQIEFEVNVRAENEITKMLHMLHEIQKKLQIDTSNESELEQMKESINIQELHETLTKEENKESLG